MKFIYKTLILGIMYLLSQTTFAQFEQIRVDPQSSAGPEEIGERDNCFCFLPVDLNSFTGSYDAAASGGLAYEWLLRQEELLKYEFEKNFGRVNDPFPDFLDAQRTFFKAFPPVVDESIKYRDNILENTISNLNVNIPLYQSSKAKSVMLSTWARELENIQNGNPREHYFGDLTYEGNVIENITDGYYLALQIGKHNDEYENQLDRVRSLSEIEQKLDLAKEQKLFERYIADRYIDHYNDLPFKEAMEVMTRYTVQDFSVLPSPYDPNLTGHFSFGPPPFKPENFDYTNALSLITVSAGGPITGVTPYDLSTSEAIFEYALETNFSTTGRGFLKNNQNVKNKLKEYLRFNEYAQSHLDFGNDLLTSYTNNSSFPHDRYNYSLDAGDLFSIKFQNQQNPNQAFTMVQHNTPPFDTFHGLDHLLSSLSSLQNPNQEFIGQFALELLRDNGVQIPATLTAADMFSIFNFTPRDPYANLGRYTIGLDFRNNIGQTLWDNGIRFPEMLQNPFALAAALALAQGGDYGDIEPELQDPFVIKNMTPQQKESFKNAVNQMKETCLGQDLLNLVNAVNVSVGELSPGAVAQYVASTNTIVFSADRVGDGLGEELFHSYQQQLYGTLVDISNPSSGHVGGSNIEFEEKAYSLLRDLITQHNDLLGDVSGGATTGDLTGVFAGTFDLLNWMDMFFENHKDDDLITELSPSELESWFNALDMFQKKNFRSNGCGNGDVYGCPIDETIKPDAILQLFNSVLQKGCIKK